MRTQSLNVWGVSLGLCLLGGCAHPPPVQEPPAEVEIPGTYAAAQAIAWDVPPATSTNWLLDFADPRLASLVEEALLHNQDLRVAATRVEAARGGALLAGADAWPRVNATGLMSRTQRTSSGGFAILSAINDRFDLGGSLSWELDVWGRVRDVHSAALADLQVAEADLYGARLSLAAQTVRSWFDVLEADLQVRLAEETLASFEKNLKVVEGGFERGVSSALDVRLTRANAASALATRESRRRQRDGLVRSLEVLLGRYPAEALAVSGGLPELSRGVPAGLPSELLWRRPDLIAAERRLAAATRRKRAALKALLPAFSLTTSGGTSTSQFRDVVNLESAVWNLAGNLSQPLFQGGRIRAGILQAEAGRESTLAAYAAAVLRGFLEVESALAAGDFLRDEASALSLTAEESQAAEDLAWEEYQRGLVDIITVLESERRAFNARAALLQVRRQRLQNRLDLYLALGGEFQLPLDSAASGLAGGGP